MERTGESTEDIWELELAGLKRPRPMVYGGKRKRKSEIIPRLVSRGTVMPFTEIRNAWEGVSFSSGLG